MKKVTLALLVVLLALFALATFPTYWDGSDTVVYAFGLVYVDAYDGMITIPALDWHYCPPASNCGMY